MSATTDSVTRPLSPVVYVQSLSLEDKQAVLVALLREAIQINGNDAPMPIEDESGQSMGYYLPPKPVERPRKTRPNATSEQQASVQLALNTTEDSCTLDELMLKIDQSPTEQNNLEQRLQYLDDAIPIGEVIADFKQRLVELQIQQSTCNIE